MIKGKFVVLEGIDGAGTTTQAILLAKYLFNMDKKNDILLTREPTKHSPYGQEIRRRLVGELLEGEEVIDDQNYWADLFINDRKWHLDNFIIPALDKGQQVVCDRHKLSTVAYQSVETGKIDYLIEKQKNFYPPDITFLLDTNAEIAAQRLSSRVNREYFDRLDFQKKIKEQYLKAAKYLQNTENIVIIDGNKSIGEVAEAIRKGIVFLYGYAKAT